MRLLLTASIIILWFGETSMASEEISYEIIKKDGDIEIRQYEPIITAEVTVQSSRRDATGEGFRALFNFINGDNVAQEKISMTAPVSQKVRPSSQKIPMTTPVSQEASETEGMWTIAFYMPNTMKFDTTPRPTNNAVKIREHAAERKIAIRFSGRSTDKNIGAHEKVLRDYIDKKNLNVSEPPMYAFYDPPWTPWFMRRNEVLFTLEK